MVVSLFSGSGPRTWCRGVGAAVQDAAAEEVNWTHDEAAHHDQRRIGRRDPALHRLDLVLRSSHPAKQGRSHKGAALFICGDGFCSGQPIKSVASAHFNNYLLPAGLDC